MFYIVVLQYIIVSKYKLALLYFEVYIKILFISIYIGIKSFIAPYPF
jgi:hypothetical protein